MSLTPGTTLGPYEVIAEIGKGGMGEVYRARDTKLDRDVALKVLPQAFTDDPDRLARFEREAKVLASLNHPNIGHIYGLEEADGQKALVLELVEGPTLAERIKQGPIPVDEALPIAKQIAEALEAAHEQGIIHRDLKPANIKVKDDGTVKVLDFGLAKAFQPDASDPNMSQSPTISLTAAATQMGMVIGTAAYMAPEQAKGKVVDKRADVWAFGAVLYEMLTGQKPFVGDDVSDTLALVLKFEPEWDALPADTPARIRQLIQTCLQKDPKQRVHDVADVRLAMEGAFETGAQAAGSVAAVAPAPWRRVRLVLATAVVVSAVAAPAGWLLKPAEPRPVVRSVHALPDGRSLAVTGLSQLIIAPDGEYFVYRGNDGLYLRTLDALEDRLIPGTEETQLGPFLSPDGQSVGFFRAAAGGRAVTELVRLAVTGGVPVKLADAGIPYGASWGTDGMILYGQSDGIWQVSENGGEPEHLIATDSQVERVYGPQRLPGGDWVLLTVAPAAGPAALWDEADIVVESLTSGERKVLRQGGATDARYLPTGHVVYVHRNVLYAVPFDVGSLAVLGGPVPVVEGIRVGVPSTAMSGAASYAVTTGGTLVYMPGSVATAGNTLAWVDPSGRQDFIDLPPGQYAHPRFSPDGQWLALERQDGTRTDVWLYEVSGATALRRLTEGGTNRYPVWSREGEHVVFQSDRDGDVSIFWQRADGTGTAERLTTPESDAVHIPEAWSPTDDRLVFSAVTGTRVELWVWALEDRESERFGDLQSSVPFNTVFSPDGQWVAYTQRDTQRAGDAATYVQSVSAPDARFQIGRDEETVHHPLWTPDGSRLFYFPGPGDAVAVDVTTGTRWRMNTTPIWPTWCSTQRVVFGRKSSPSCPPSWDGSSTGRSFTSLMR